MERQRILQVIDQLGVGGAERVLVDLSNILNRHQHIVSVLTLVRSGKLSMELDNEIRTINLGRNFKYSLPSLRRCNRLCENYDIVHVHLRYNFRYVALARWLFGGKYRILLHDHFGDIENDTGIPIGLRFLLNRKRVWFAGVSGPLFDWAVHRVGLDPRRAFLLSNIVIAKECGDHQFRRQSSVVKLLHVSNFRDAKNHAFAFKLISELRNHFELRICFVGQIIDRSFYLGLLEQIEKQGISSIITINHDCRDVQQLSREFDLAIHTAYQESGPLVLIEYLAQQLPFVAFKAGEVSNQVSSMLPEFFMDDFEISKWVDRIKQVLSHRMDYENRMKETFWRHYSSEGYYNKCMNIYSAMQHG